MELFKQPTQINFLGLRWWTSGFSLILVLAALLCIFVKGINWGLDFTGGVVIELAYPQAVSISEVREQLDNAGYTDAVVQNYGTSRELMVRLAPRPELTEQNLAESVFTALSAAEPDAVLLRFDAVGAQIGGELTEQGFYALLLALLLTAGYIAFRYQYRLAISAALALAHDPIIVLGVFALFQVEFDLPTLAAILAVIGYSLNDTIVVFDRIKENFYQVRRQSVMAIVNLSINQTLSRTIMTSALTLLVVIALLVYGGQSIFGFSLALLIGVVVGTYSSIYIAGTLATSFGLTQADMLPPSQEELDARP